MTRHFIMDRLMKAQEQVIKEHEYECWSCAEYVPESRIVAKVWRDRQNGIEMNKLICFKCIETGDWLK